MEADAVGNQRQSDHQQDDSASTFTVGSAGEAPIALAENSDGAATTTAATMMESRRIPTAVMTESSEKMMSSSMICRSRRRTTAPPSWGRALPGPELVVISTVAFPQEQASGNQDESRPRSRG